MFSTSDYFYKESAFLFEIIKNMVFSERFLS